jgi:hypothetical protein
MAAAALVWPLTDVVKRIREAGEAALEELLAGGPALVIATAPDAPLSPVVNTDTPAAGLRADMVRQTAPGRRHGSLQSLLGGTSIVVPFAKTDRNPFGALITVGRGPTNDIRLTSSGVSKLHAVFRHTPEGWRVRDLRSRNGTHVGMTRLEPQREHPIDPGAVIRFGDVECMFVERRSLQALVGIVRVS